MSRFAIVQFIKKTYPINRKKLEIANKTDNYTDYKRGENFDSENWNVLVEFIRDVLFKLLSQSIYT